MESFNKNPSLSAASGGSDHPLVDAEVCLLIEHTAGYVERNGPEFESLLRQKSMDDPRFGFLLPNHPYHALYNQTVLQKRSKLVPENPQTSSQEGILNPPVHNPDWLPHDAAMTPSLEPQAPGVPPPMQAYPNAANHYTAADAIAARQSQQLLAQRQLMPQLFSEPPPRPPPPPPAPPPKEYDPNIEKALDHDKLASVPMGVIADHIRHKRKTDSHWQPYWSVDPKQIDRDWKGRQKEVSEEDRDHITHLIEKLYEQIDQ